MDYHNSPLTETFLATGGRGTVRFYVIAGVAAAALAIALICKVKGKKKKVNTDKE